MARNKAAREIRDIAEIVATNKSTAERAVAKTRQARQVEQQSQDINQANERLDAAGVIADDEIPPAQPTGLTATPLSRGLTVLWDRPPESDKVVETRVEWQNLNTGVSANRTTVDANMVLTALDRTAYRLRIKHIDYWGRESLWSSTVDATPLFNVADQIAASVQVQANQIFGTLGLTNIPAITDPAKLVSGLRDALTNMGQTEDRFINANLMVAWTVAAGQAIIEDGTINRALIANAAIGEAQIDALAVTAAKIALATITNAQIASATIEAAKIKTVDVGTLLAGTIKVAIGMTSTGYIQTIGATMDQNGIRLNDSDIYLTLPSDPNSEGAWITGPNRPNQLPNPGMGIGFFSGGGVRGMRVHASGIASQSNNMGTLYFTATNGANQGLEAISTAVINVQSGATGLPGGVAVGHNFSARGNIRSTGGYILAGSASGPPPLGQVRGESVVSEAGIAALAGGVVADNGTVRGGNVRAYDGGNQPGALDVDGKATFFGIVELRRNLDFASVEQTFTPQRVFDTGDLPNGGLASGASQTYNLPYGFPPRYVYFQVQNDQGRWVVNGPITPQISISVTAPDLIVQNNSNARQRIRIQVFG